MKVGDYVRIDGTISKIIDIDNKTFDEPCFSLDNFPVGYRSLSILEDAKTSPNIIDLIEVGDVIRFRLDNVAMETKGYLTGVMDIEDEETINQIKNSKDERILSIVTKEQFEAMEYKVGE